MFVVTGATGFIGSALIWELNERGIQDILAVDTVSPEDRPDPLENRKYQRFVRTHELWDTLRDLGSSQQVEWVFHIGACSDTREQDRSFLYENNTFYTQRLFEWCAEQSTPFIYASSAATYGNGELGFTEDISCEQLRPLNPYGESKLNFDRWLRQRGTPKQFPCYGLRFFNVYGPNEYHKGEQSSVVLKAHRQIRDTGKLKLFRSHNPAYRDGEQKRDFVYIKDITRWCLELTEKTPPSEIYNMGFGQARSWLDLARAVFTSMNKETQIDWIDVPADLRNQYQYFTEARMEKWLSVGMSPPRWDIETGVKDYLENYLIPGDRHL